MHNRIHSPTNSAVKGFTLMEVLMALLIVSLGMLAVIEAVSQAASNTSYLRDKTIAHWVAMNRITELRLQRQAPSIGETTGEVEMANQRWRWRSAVTQTPVASIMRIDVDAGLADAPEDSYMTSISGFFGSTIAPPGGIRVSWQAAPLLNGGNSPGQNPNDPNNPNNPNNPNIPGAPRIPRITPTPQSNAP
jgi:general secretion pathway protein I